MDAVVNLGVNGIGFGVSGGLGVKFEMLNFVVEEFVGDTFPFSDSDCSDSDCSFSISVSNTFVGDGAGDSDGVADDVIAAPLFPMMILQCYFFYQ